MTRWLGVMVLGLLTGCATLRAPPSPVLAFFPSPSAMVSGLRGMSQGTTPGGCKITLAPTVFQDATWTFYIAANRRFVALGKLREADGGIAWVAMGTADVEKDTWRTLTIAPYDPARHVATLFDQWLCGMEASK